MIDQDLLDARVLAVMEQLFDQDLNSVAKERE
jgi:hypothetical protein